MSEYYPIEGDLIRITDSEDARTGAVYMITSIDGDEYYVDRTFDDGSPLFFFRNEFEVITKEDDSMANTKAQVGDLIRITESWSSYYETGDILEVIYVEDDYNVIVKGGHIVSINEFLIHRKAGEEDSEKTCEKCASFVGTENEGSFCSRECIERTQRKHVVAKQPPFKDAVNPQHYKQGRVEVIDIIEDAVKDADPFEAVCQANVLKYALRYRAKNGVEDLRKMLWYGEKLVAYLDAKSTQD